MLTFEEFAGHLQIPSKDEGIVPLRLWGAQTYALEQIRAGLAHGIHHYLFLKGARQIGGTTGFLSHTLFWLLSHGGLQGAFVGDTDANTKYFRSLLRFFVSTLPPELTWPSTEDNEGQLVWANGSRMMFLTAGVRETGRLARGRGANVLLGDECASWTDQEGLASLNASLSERHPDRLYLMVSTARGFNLWHRLWQEAADSITRRRIFLGFWLHAHYRIERDDVRWPRYGTPAPSQVEQEKIAIVRRDYGVEVAPEVLAWRRWKRAEEIQDDQLLDQEFGWLPEDVFVAFGAQVISAVALERMRQDALARPAPVGLEYHWKDTLDRSRALPTERPDAELRIWEEPQAGAIYVVSEVPVGVMPKSRLSVVQVWRCWPDALRQVAEYASPSASMGQVAWVVAHLCGAYRARFYILEIGEAGEFVLRALNLLANVGWGVSPGNRGGMVRELLGSVQHYLWRRADSMTGPSALQWKTTLQNHDWVIHQVVDLGERGLLEPADPATLDEFAALRRLEDKGITPGGVEGEDRALAAALATEAYLQMVLPWIGGRIATRAEEEHPPSAVERTVAGFLSDLGRTNGPGPGKPRSPWSGGGGQLRPRASPYTRRR